MTDRVEAEALVLSHADAGSDRIWRVLTADDQVVPLIGKQARRSATRRGAARLEPLSRAALTYRGRPSDDLARLESAQPLEAFAILKGDVLRFTLASAMAEVTLHLVADFGREDGLHDLLLRAWRWLDAPQNRPVEDLLLLFELRALALTGSLPPIDELVGLPLRAREVLDAWLAGHWRLLEPRDGAAVAAALEARLTDATGRRLRARGVLDQLLPR